MPLLLDTNAFLWMIFQRESLSPRARDAVFSGSEPLLLPSVSVYEILFKSALGKLTGVDPLVRNFAMTMARFQVAELPLTAAHAAKAAQLDVRHRDPFDRFIAGQSIVEGYDIVSPDQAFDQFGATRIW